MDFKTLHIKYYKLLKKKVLQITNPLYPRLERKRWTENIVSFRFPLKIRKAIRKWKMGEKIEQACFI